MKVLNTPYVEITNYRNGDEKHYWCKVPDGETVESAGDKAMDIVLKDITDMGRNPNDYTFAVGNDRGNMTMRAIYSVSGGRRNGASTGSKTTKDSVPMQAL